MGAQLVQCSDRETCCQMRASLLLLFTIGHAAGNLLEYNYYFELNDVVSKVSHLSFDYYELAQYAFKGDTINSKIATASAVSHQASELIEPVIGLDVLAKQVEAIAAALAGDCAPFHGYPQTFVDAPFAAVYSKEFWCTKV